MLSPEQRIALAEDDLDTFELIHGKDMASISRSVVTMQRLLLTAILSATSAAVLFAANLVRDALG